MRVMFTDTGAHGPKSVTIRSEETTHPGMSVRRPEKFPEQFWKFCCPKERTQVQARFDKYVSVPYLKECIQKVISE